MLCEVCGLFNSDSVVEFARNGLRQFFLEPVDVQHNCSACLSCTAKCLYLLRRCLEGQQLFLCCSVLQHIRRQKNREKNQRRGEEMPQENADEEEAENENKIEEAGQMVRKTKTREGRRIEGRKENEE